MLGVPGYADDSVFFTIRYADRAKVSLTTLPPAACAPGLTAQNTLRSCDWEEFRKTLDQITDVWVRSGTGGGKAQPLPIEERYAKLAELRKHALDIIQDFPDLVRDFDRFTDSSKAALSAVLRSKSK